MPSMVTSRSTTADRSELTGVPQARLRGTFLSRGVCAAVSLLGIAPSAGCVDREPALASDERAARAFLARYEECGSAAAFPGVPEFQQANPQSIRNVSIERVSWHSDIPASMIEGRLEALTTGYDWQAGTFTLFVQDGKMITTRFPGPSKPATAPES